MPRSRIRKQFGGTKSKSNLLVLFIPSVDRNHMPVDQRAWVGVALDLLGTHFGGATAFPRARGVWRDDDQAGRLIFDEPVVIQCYTDEGMLIAHSRELREFLERLGRDTNQGAVGFVIDNDYFEISFP